MGQFLSHFAAYAQAVGYYWIAIMAGVILVASDLVGWVIPPIRRVPKDVRRPIEIALMIFAVLFAGFEAWQDENGERIHAQQAAQDNDAARRTAQGLANERWQEIHGDNGYVAQIRELQDKLTAAQNKPPKIVYVPTKSTVTAPQAPAAPASDPDTIYQLGDAVATVVGAKVDRENGRVTFEHIYAHGGLDRTANFEYREYVLHFVSLEAETDVTQSGPKNENLVGVTCRIVGKAR